MSRPKRERPPRDPNSTQWLWIIGLGVVLAVFFGIIGLGMAAIWYLGDRSPTNQSTPAGSESSNAGSPAPSASAEPPDPNRQDITFDEFLLIKNGMTLFQVRALLATPHSESAGRLGEPEQRILQWTDRRTYQATITLQSDRVVETVWYDITNGRLVARAKPPVADDRFGENKPDEP